MTKTRFFIQLLIIIVALSLTVVLIHAQEPQPPDEELMPGEPEAVVGNVIPIQGFLTDPSGVPLNGPYDIRASIYDVSTGGVARCSDLDPNTPVNNGLFNMDMHNCDPQDINGDSLWLGITVETDPEMTPRRHIYPVPYAFTVRPGAIIKGSTSYLFTPGIQFIKENSSDSTRWSSTLGSALIYRGATPGAKTIRIPITIPAVLYGQPVQVTQARIYYSCAAPASNYITSTELDRQAANGTVLVIASEITDRQSGVYTYYNLSGAYTNNTFTADEGILALRITMEFANDASNVKIGGVRLTLVTNY